MPEKAREVIEIDTPASIDDEFWTTPATSGRIPELGTLHTTKTPIRAPGMMEDRTGIYWEIV